MRVVQCFCRVRQVQTSASVLKKPAKFYKTASVSSHEAGDKFFYNIFLDERKLKSPSGKIFETESKPLAYAVCQEWNLQDKILQLDRMLLTKLSFTALDNPLSLKKEDIIRSILNFLETDTILYRSDENEKLKERQQQYWNPIFSWASERFNLEMEPTYSVVEVAKISSESKENIRRFLLGYNFCALAGIEFAAEGVKSLLLTLAVLLTKVEAREAVKIALLEQQFQLESWGKVEWAHDVEFEEVVSRLSAGILFARFMSSFFHDKDIVK